MGEGEFVGLRSEAATLRALAKRLSRFGAADCAPEWLVSGVWLCTNQGDYLATASAEILPNGYVARPLNVHSPRDLIREVEAELPNVSDRLAGRGHDLDLSAGDQAPEPPDSLRHWPAGDYSTHVLIRTSERNSTLNRVACALLFNGGRQTLLVATDPSTLAMVLSEDFALIERYRADCEPLPVDEYLERFGR